MKKKIVCEREKVLYKSNKKVTKKKSREINEMAKRTKPNKKRICCFTFILLAVW